MGQTNTLFDQAPRRNAAAYGNSSSLVTAFPYRSTVQEHLTNTATHDAMEEPGIRITEDALAHRLAEERTRGSMEAETRIRCEMEERRATDRALIAESIRSFEQTRKEYFAKVEGEVIQLALSIARKILYREAQVDPLLIAALVQIALSQMKKGSAVSVRVRPEEAAQWRKNLNAEEVDVVPTVIEDDERKPGDCVLETEMGSANFSLDAQLKEVEQGFLDVLAQTPSF